ncbi:CCA tRNA nucleotidyltransferase [Terrarubrum flagellatum]|uniref:CCA tRNA nucleotidyltransferase n=1 Tax=Terrirubrum flagellatum TaxID=2895980 RepID=UPI0031452566
MTAKTARVPDPTLFSTGPVSKLLAAIGGEGEEIRVVGGAVRNAMLRIAPSDFDCATTTLPDETIRRATRAGFRTIPTGIEHGTVTVLVDDKPFEVTTLRADIATDGRRATVRFGRDFEADAQRRDFTINALTADADGVVTDYVGGLDDLAARRVRFIGDAGQRIREDYLRILRLFRFHATYGEGPVDRAALIAAIRERDGLDILSRERVRSELMKLMKAPRALAVLEEMSETGFATRILGGATNLARLEKGLEESGVSLSAAQRLGLFAVECAEDVERLRAKLALSNEETETLARIARVSETLRASGYRPTQRALRELAYRLGREIAPAAHAILAAADVDASEASALSGWTPPDLPWRGADALAAGASPGPEIGAWLARAEALWIDEGFPSGSEALERIWAKARPVA